MNFLKRLSLVPFSILFLVKFAPAQQSFEIMVDSTANRTDLTKDMGHDVKFLATSNRLVVLDMENSRILFYQKGTNFADNIHLASVGDFGKSSNLPFDTAANPKFSNEYTGTIYHDTLWITNYGASEILLFDLNGTYLSRMDGSFRILTSYGDSLVAFRQDSVFIYSAATRSFSSVAVVPQSLMVNQDAYGANVKIRSRRLVVKKDSLLYVYDAEGYLSGSQTDTLFTLLRPTGADFEIMENKIVWCTDYGGPLAYCDLDGNNRTDTISGIYTYTYHYAGGNLYITGSFGYRLIDDSFNVLAGSSRGTFYLSLQWLGVNDSTLFFLDFANGGFVYARLDYASSTFLYKQKDELAYSGSPRILRHGIGKQFLLSGFATMYVYVFNIDSDTVSWFNVPQSQNMDAVGDTIVVLSGERLLTYLPTGDTLSIDTLSNLGGANLANMDTASTATFAISGDKVFIGFSDTLYVLSRSGSLQSRHYFDQLSSTKLFSAGSHIVSNIPLQAYQIDIGAVAPYPGVSVSNSGYVYDGQYWYESGMNAYSFVPGTLVGVEKRETGIPTAYSLKQNFPNPFNPTTHICFDVPQASRIRLEVFNILGQRIATLVDGPAMAGNNEVIFDATGLPSGLYFYTLNTTGYTRTKKMLLLK